MRDKNSKIDFEIYIVFLIVIGVTVFNAIYSSLNITQNQEVTSQIVNVDIPTIQQLQNMNLLVTRSKMYTTNWVYLQSNKADKESLRRIHAEQYPLLKGDISALMSEWRDKNNVDSMNLIFGEFEELISSEKKIMRQLSSFDDYEDATKKFIAGEIIESEILPQSSKIISHLDHVISNKKEQAGYQNLLMISSYKTLLWSVSGIAIIIIVVVLMAAFYMSNSMIVPLMRLKSFVVQMGKGEVPEINLPARRGAVGLMTIALKDLTQAMKQTANFANEIGDGNFDVKFKPLSEHDEFGNALLQMRDNLQKAEYDLKQRNEDLKKTARLMKDKNEALETVRAALSIKARELELNSRYKSEFLANMSHELRTPLNSVLILARLLAENKNKLLTEKEIEYANVIHKSGTDLLMLINDILDLSKIEAGKFEMQFEPTPLTEIKNNIHLMFRELANDKKIDFVVEMNGRLPQEINTDRLRLEQVIKNLLSNAFKFTNKEAGVVKFSIDAPKHGILFSNKNLLQSAEVIAISVTDNGIGIAPDKQKLIFEAFKQADGSTSRKYGGTGLGLSISRELAQMLGGEIQVKSAEGRGSTFTLYIPVEGSNESSKKEEQPDEPEMIYHPGSEAEENRIAPIHKSQTKSLPDDRNTMIPSDKIILIIEDDRAFAKILYDFAHENGFKAIVATQGDIGLALAAQYKPAAILLDIQLPVIDGLTVLKRLKENETLRHIPVHIMSVMDRKNLGMEMGAVTFLKKPIDKKDLDNSFSLISKSIENQIRKVLVVEDEPMQFEIIKNLIQSNEKNAKCIHAREALEAYSLIAEIEFDCIILDLNLGNDSISGYRLLEKIKCDGQLAKIPVIVYTGTVINEEQKAMLDKYSNSVIIKSPETFTTLLEQTASFLHRIKEQPVITAQDSGICNEKSVLVVDDDMRNIYAISGILESEGLKVIVANNGKEALDRLKQYDNIDLVLMDIMMPEMDGYTAMREIRKMDKYKKLPIIAVTAKAMTGDREKCINAGATDYLAKPVNVDQLLSLMKMYLYKEVQK